MRLAILGQLPRLFVFMDFFSKHRLAQETKQCLRDLMLHICSAQTSEGAPLLLEVVAAGPTRWRITMMREAKGFASDGSDLPIDETICNQIFAFFCRQVTKRYGMSAGQALDALEIETPPTDAELQKEIDESWMVESASSDEAKRKFGQSSSTDKVPLILH